jgi:hypothetical protein
MAKTRAPLLSFGARGQIGKTAVYASWRGVPYVRERVTPANPRTTSQTNNRSIFGNMRAIWKVMPADARAPWDAFASGRPFTGMNAFLGQNVAALQGDSDLTDLILSPGARGGFPAASVSAVTGGAGGEIDVTITAPTLPSGWTVTDTFAVAVEDFDPTTTAPGVVFSASDNSSPYEPNLTGLTATTDYAVGAFIEYEKPNGQTAYSVSDVSIVTSG